VEIIRDLAWSPSLEQGSVVTVGEYDGVHRGHRTVIAEMHRMAAERGCATAVVTFDRHPATVVRPDSAPALLCDLETKLELLAETGVDYTLVVEFTPEQAEVSAETFARQVLVGSLQAKVIVVGADFHFGKNRRGNVDTLKAVGDECGYQVVGLPLVKQITGEGEVISSTSIRMAVADGDVEKAHRLLGRPFEVRGTVTPGDRRGRTIGFPTANLPTTPDLQVPSDGVYAAWYQRPDGTQYPAAVNIGKRPTFYDFAERSLIEAHLIGFRGDLYGEQAKVRFVQRLRGERRFEDVDQLVAQLGKDVVNAAQCLSD
jgi:riboflavin kinase/FMN adenylyltransferase